MSNVKDFGAKGDGEQDDTEAIVHALRDGDGGLVFPRGTYRITKPIEVNLEAVGRTGVSGSRGVAKIVNAGAGPAFRFVGTHSGTANPAGFEPGVWADERMPSVTGIEIEGAHAEADGIELRGTAQAVLEAVAVRECRHGVRLTQRNRNVIISHCHLYHNRGIGVWLDQVNLHQINIVGSHISYNRLGGLRIEGSEIRNLQVTGNDIEYNNHASHGTDPEPTAEIYIDTTADGASVAEFTIASNTIQATVSPGGANIRIVGTLEQRHSPGLGAITGNIIGSQENPMHLTGCRAMTITGNIIYSSQQHTLLVERSKQITISANNFRRHTPARGLGVRLVDTRDSIISACQFSDESEEGQASGLSPLELRGCARINITGCQVMDGVPFGIDVADSSQVNIAQCQVLEQRAEKASRAAIRWAGSGEGNRLSGNMLTAGTEGETLIEDGAGEGLTVQS